MLGELTEVEGQWFSRVPPRLGGGQAGVCFGAQGRCLWARLMLESGRFSGLPG
jgi:hypothetical protein